MKWNTRYPYEVEFVSRDDTAQLHKHLIEKGYQDEPEAQALKDLLAFQQPITPPPSWSRHMGFLPVSSNIY